MKFKHFMKAYERDTQEYPKRHFVLHFRIGTSGVLRCAEMTHPFRITQDLAFVHNGILSSVDDLTIVEDDGRTELICQDCLAWREYEAVELAKEAEEDQADDQDTDEDDQEEDDRETDTIIAKTTLAGKEDK